MTARRLLAVVLAVCGSAAAVAGDVVTVTLQPTARNAGQIGRAFLMPQESGTRVRIEVSGVPPLLASRPVQLYTHLYVGTCERRAPDPAFALTDRVLADSPSGVSIAPARGPYFVSNSVPFPLDRLRAGPYAIVVRTAPADGNFEIFCGDVGS